MSSHDHGSQQSPSPRRHLMRRTLRTGSPSERSHRPGVSSPGETPGASTAASLAWGTTEGRSSPGVRTQGDSSILPSFLRPRKPLAPPHSTSGSRSPRPVSPRRGQVNVEPLPSPPARVTRAKELQSESSLISLSAAARALKPATSHIPPGTNNHKAGSDRRAPSRSEVLPNADPTDTTRKARDPAPRRVRRHVPEDQPRRKPTAPKDDSPQETGRTEGLAKAKGAQTDSRTPRHRPKEVEPPAKSQGTPTSETCTSTRSASPPTWGPRESEILANLPEGIDQAAARQILGELVVRGDEVHWDDVAGLEAAKSSLREAVVYPFLRPDLFIGLRQPACGILLFGPPGTGKTMLARAVATESRSMFFSLSASSLTSKYLGDSEKLVRALFTIARMIAPSIIFVDEIDSLLGQRSGSADHETTRRIKTEFLIQWSNLQRAVPSSDDPRGSGGDANRVLVLAATNLPWAIDEAARRRFVKRQYIPLPEPDTRGAQLLRLLSQQNHTLKGHDIERLVTLTEGYSGSDLAALAKDAAMGPLRSLGEALLHMPVDEIRPMELADFEASLASIRPSVSPSTLLEHEDWAQKFGEWRK